VTVVDARRSSGELDRGSGRGVGPAVVVLLVLGALVVGFLLGWSFARMG
jgi:hypothetical protein